MTAKKKHVQKLLSKLRDGSPIAPTFREAIDSLVLAKDDPPLADFEARGGNLDHLKGDALYAYLELQSGRQRRQLEQNAVELEETIYRINQLLDNHGFLPYMQPEASAQQEHDSHFFHVIKEAKVQEQGVLTTIFEYIEMHMAKAKQQYDAMKEIEQWFLDMLNDKGLENEFSQELLSIRQRHREQVVSDEAVEDTLRRVQQTGQKLKEIGDILILTSSDGVKVFDGPPPDPENTCTLLVPNEDNTDTRFVFTVILDDELMFREEKVQLLAQQYLKGMIFYGSAARHKNRAQKRKVIRLMMRQLEAIYNFIKRLRAAVFAAQGDASNQKARAEDMVAQKDQAYKDRDRYRAQVDDGDSLLKKAIAEADHLRLEKTMMEATLKELRDAQTSISSTPSRHRSNFDTIIHHESHSSHPSSANIIGLPPRKGIRSTGVHLSVELEEPEDTGPSTVDLTVVGGPREAISRDIAVTQKKRRKRGDKPDQETPGTDELPGLTSPQNVPLDGKAPEGWSRDRSEAQSAGSARARHPSEPSSGRDSPSGEPQNPARSPRMGISKERRGIKGKGGSGAAKEGEEIVEDQEEREGGKSPENVTSEEDHFPQAVTSLELFEVAEPTDNEGAPEPDKADQRGGSRPDSLKKAHKHGKSRRASRHRTRGSVDKSRRSVPHDEKEQEPIQQQDEGVGDSEYKEESDATQTQQESGVSETTETEDGSTDCPVCPACPPPPAPPETAEQEVQFGTAPDQKVAGVNKATAVQRSLIQFEDFEAQPSFTGLSPEEQAVYEDTIEKVATYEEQVETLTNELEELRTDQEESETRAHDAEVLLRTVEDKATRLEVENITMQHLLQKTEEEKDQVISWAHDIEMEAEQKQAALDGLEALVSEQKKQIESYQKDKKSQSSTTEGDIFGITVQLQTDEITSGEAKTELQKLKTVLADFRRSMIGVLISQNLIADIPSFPEQLRDTWNAASGAAEIVLDVKEHFAVLTDIIAQAFEHREAEHRAAFQALAQKRATEIEKTITGTDSSEDMRKVRLKLRQRLLELEVENSQMHDMLKTMTKLLEDKRASYEGQLSQKEDNAKKQREEIRKMKDLAWSLAESLAKLRDEGIARMPERKSLADMMQLLQAVEQKVGKKIRTQERRTVVPQMLVTGAHVVDPNAKAKSDHTEHGSALHEHPSGHTAESYGLNVIGLSRTLLPEDRSKESFAVSGVTSGHEDSPRCVTVQVETVDKGMSTSDRIGRAMTEITHFFLDPHNDWTVRSATREVAFGHKVIQTSDDPNEANIAQLDENGQPLPTDGVLFTPSHGRIYYDTPFGTAQIRGHAVSDREAGYRSVTPPRSPVRRAVQPGMVGHIGLVPGSEMKPAGSGYASSPAMIHSFDKFVPHHGPIPEVSHHHMTEPSDLERNIAALPGFDNRHQIEAAASHIGVTVHGVFRDLAARDPHEALHEHLLHRSSIQQRRSSLELRPTPNPKNQRDEAGLKAIMSHCDDCEMSASRHSLVKTTPHHPRPLQTGVTQLEEQVHTGGHYYLAGSPPYYATPAFVRIPKEPGSPGGMSGQAYTPRVPHSKHAEEQRIAAQAAMDDAENILADLEKRLMQQVEDARHARTIQPDVSKDSSLVDEEKDELMSLPSRPSVRLRGAESQLLEEVQKIRRARGRVSEVKVRLNMLENEVQYPLAVAHREPRTVQTAQKHRRHSLETLRQETKMIKDDIRALVRGQKRVASSNRRRSAEDAEDQDRRQRRLEMEQERDRQTTEEKASRRKKINNIDQIITKFVQPESELSANASLTPQFSEFEQPSSPLRMEGKGTRPNELQEVRTVGKEKTGMGQLKRTDIPDFSLPNGSITEKLKNLHNERMAQAPKHLERMPENPLIRTPRGLEPLEGPVDLVPYNFPEMGVIGRPLQPKTRKGSELKWVQADSVAVKEPETEVNIVDNLLDTNTSETSSI